MPRVRLAWRKGERVYRTARVAALALAGEMASSDSGRLRIASWLLDSSPSPEDDWIGGRHHMGGTRMAVSPAEGVVDGDARVFGTSNLYIAGSSVFPSSGHANPTLTLVQLSLRLAKLLNSELGRLAHGV
jgi:choline dehydrogenase-like flavoprotein